MSIWFETEVKIYGICVTFRRHITIFLNQIYENAEADIHNEIRTCYILLKLLNWGRKGDYFILMVQKTELLMKVPWILHPTYIKTRLNFGQIGRWI